MEGQFGDLQTREGNVALSLGSAVAGLDGVQRNQPVRCAPIDFESNRLRK